MTEAIDIQVRDNQSTAVRLGSMKAAGAYGLRYSTVLPGGCGECTFNLPAKGNTATDYMVPPSAWGYNYRVDLVLAGEIIWSGRMEDLALQKSGDSVHWTIKALGYGVNLNDQVYTTQAVNNVETSTIISNAITSLAPQIGATSITASGYTITNTATVTLKLITAAAVIAWAAKYGDATFNPQVWYVYPDVDGTIRFTFADRPTTVSIIGLIADFEEADFALFGKNLYNKAQVQYNGGASVLTDNTTNLAKQSAGPGGWGVIKTLIAVLPEISQSADATQAASAMMTQFGVPRIAATSLRTSRTVDQLNLKDSNGDRVNPLRIRAGSLMQMLDMPDTAGAYQGIQWANTFLIAGTDYDEDSQTLTLTPEGYDNSAQKLLAKVDYLLRGRLGLTGVA